MYAEFGTSTCDKDQVPQCVLHVAILSSMKCFNKCQFGSPNMLGTWAFFYSKQCESYGSCLNLCPPHDSKVPGIQWVET